MSRVIDVGQRFYLAPFVGSGESELDAFRPPVDGPASILDLRGDPTAPDGWCLLWVPDGGTPKGRTIDLGDDPDGQLPAQVKRKLANDLRLDLAAASVGEIAAELLLTHATPEGDKTRPNPLRFSRRKRRDPKDGSLAQYRGIYLGPPGHRIWEQYYKGGPGATFTEDWNAADTSDGDISNDLTWTKVRGAGKFDIDTNVIAYKNSDDGIVFYRAEHDLSTDDHYMQADLVSIDVSTTYARVGIRAHSSDETYYYTRHNRAGSGNLYKYVTGSFTSLSSFSSQGDPDGLLVYFEADGSDLTYKTDGTTRDTVTDTAITGNTRTIIGGSASGDDWVRWDNFEASDLGAVTTELTGSIGVSIDLGQPVLLEVKELDGQADASISATGSASQTHEATGTPTASVSVSGALTVIEGATELTGSVSVSIDIASAEVEEIEQLSGSLGLSIEATGSLTHTHELDGSPQSTVQASGSLTQTNELNGSVSASIQATGQLAETEALRGQSDLSIKATGALAHTHELSGTVQASIEATGSLVETEQLNGSADTSIEATGTLAQTHELAGQSDVSISTSGSLEVEGTTELTGTVEASILVTGALTQVHETAATPQASIEATGRASQIHEATGDAQAAVQTTGSASQTHELNGTLSASIEASGITEQTQELAGSSQTSIEVSGALTIEALADLQASLALAVQVTGQLANTHELRQTLAQTLSVVGALRQIQEATAQAQSQIQVSGALTVTQAITRGSNGVTDALVGSMSVSDALVGSADTSDALVGALSMSESTVGSVGVTDDEAGNVGVSDG